MNDLDYWMAHANGRRMVETGGGFHHALGRLFFKADSSNARRLIDAFPHEFLKKESDDE